MRVLAGPIVRRVEPKLAAVWVAVDSPCLVILDIYRDVQSASSLPATQATVGERAVQAGAKMFFAVVVAEFTDQELPLLPEVIYSYNLTFLPDNGGSATLKSLGLLQDRPGARPHVALGYGNDVLPSFVLPPRQLKDLNLLHGSCRRVQYDAPDAMTWIDDFIAASRTDAVKRPHQLFLTGDQIYADNLPTVMQQVLTPLANDLMGVTEALPTKFGIEPGNNGVRLLPCDLATFPPGLRKNVIMHDARMSTSDGSNHLLGFGEFCVMHLLVWCNELWPDPDQLPPLAKVYPALGAAPPHIWGLHFRLFGSHPSKDLTSDTSRPYAVDYTSEDPTQQNINDILNKIRNDKEIAAAYAKDVRITKDFMAGLARVRRALANIATYMIFDDHEITDDWNFSKIWKDQVTTSPLGRAILRNGLMAYALCQGWGNDPLQFRAQVRDEHGALQPSAQKQLLEAIPKMFPATEPDAPVSAVADQIDRLLGLAGSEVKLLATWHYRVSGPHHLVLVLDVRTRRDQSGRTAPPQNLSADALKEQIPTDSDPALVNLSPEIDVVLVISSLVVMGPPIFDTMFGPLAYKVFDIKDNFDRVTMPATDPDAIESWPNDEPAFERLLNALNPLKRVVMLSGDVHYSTSVVMSYWTDRLKPPARFAQFVCSAFKNNFDNRLAWADQSFAIFQKVLQLDDNAGRLGWNEFTGDLLSIPVGKSPVPALDARLQQAPMLLPTVGWPDGTHEKVVNPPDFAWRIHVVHDQRTDADRPEAERAAPVFAGQPNKDVTATAAAYPILAARHANLLDQMNYQRQILFSTNVGGIRFEKNGEILTAVHQLFTTHPKALVPDKPEVYMEHRVNLDAPLEQSPSIGTPS